MTGNPASIIAIGLIAVLIGMGAIATTQTPDDKDEFLGGEPFSLPALREGDHGQYVLADSHGAGRPAVQGELIEDHQRSRFIEIRAPQWFRNDTVGMQTTVMDMRDVFADFWSNLTLYLDPSTGRSLGSQSEYEWDRMDQGFFGLPLPTVMEDESRLEITRIANPLQAHCGLWNPFQGESFSLQEHPQSLCRREKVTWHAVDETEEDGARTVLFELRDERSRSIAQVVLREGISLPVLIESQAGRWVLAAFEAGDGPSARTIQSPTELPDVRFVPVTDWVLDDTGVDHPFPLSRAYQAALDGEGGELEAFLEEHPDAYLNQVRYGKWSRDTGSITYQWHLTIGTNETMIRPLVNFTIQGWDVEPLGLLKIDERQEVHVTDPEPFPGTILPRSELPDRLSRVVDLMTRYEAYTGQEANAFTFTIGCYNCPTVALGGQGAGGTVIQQNCPEEGCSGTWVQVSTGKSEGEVRTVSTSGGFEFAYDQDKLAMDATGALQFRSMNQRDSGWIRMPPEPVPATVLTPGGPPAGGTLQDVAPVVGWVAMGVGAALAFAWASKVLLGMFFTRLQRDRLLKHPGRSRIHDAISENPGIQLQELGRRSGLTIGTLRHHLSVLENGGLVKAVKGPRHKCYFLVGAVDRHILQAAPVLRSPGARRVLELVDKNPGMTTSQVAETAGKSVSGVHLHLNRLRLAGVIDGGEHAGRKNWRVVRPNVVRWASKAGKIAA